MVGAWAARWLLTAVFAAAGLGSLPVRGRAGTVRALAAVPWLLRAIGSGRRVNDRAAASHAAMSAGPSS
jgi:hypothetical protein